MPDATLMREHDGDRAVYRLGGTFDRGSAWTLRDRLEHEVVGEVLLDFSLVRDFSDLGVAILAHGITGARQRVLFRGLRQHQLRILRYCGVPVEQVPAVSDGTIPTPAPAASAGAAR